MQVRSNFSPPRINLSGPATVQTAASSAERTPCSPEQSTDRAVADSLRQREDERSRERNCLSYGPILIRRSKEWLEEVTTEMFLGGWNDLVFCQGERTSAESGLEQCNWCRPPQKGWRLLFRLFGHPPSRRFPKSHSSNPALLLLAQRLLLLAQRFLLLAQRFLLLAQRSLVGRLVLDRR